jgi:ABC-type lipoprotein release transport system permease subunit
VTPNVLNTSAHPPGYASELNVEGVSSVTPIVFTLENSVLMGPYNQDREDLAAIDPASLRQTAALTETSAAAAMVALQVHRRDLLVNAMTADDLQVKNGDSVHVLFVRGTKNQRLMTLQIVGLFTTLPGFPQGVDLVANLDYYQQAVGTTDVDFFLVRTDRQDSLGHTTVADALRSAPARATR